MSSLLDAWCATEAWQQGSSSKQVQDVTRNQGPAESSLPVILNALSHPVIACPTDKLVTHLATTDGNWRKYHWHPRPGRLPHLKGKPLTVI